MSRLVRMVVNLASRLYALANHDFCPGANRYAYWLKRPIGWFFVAALAAALTGTFVTPQGWFVCAVVSLVMVLGIAWPWLAMRGLSAAIEFDRRRCHQSDPVTVRLDVTNRWPWPVWGLLVERGFFCTPDDEQPEAATALARVAGWSKSRFEFTFHPPRRGVYPHETPLLATGFPFGLWSATRKIVVGEPIVAWPNCVELRSSPLLQGDRFAAVGSLVDRPGQDGDVLAARPYQHGDSMRRIHWAHTARRDTLIVCQRQLASRRGVVVVLDPKSWHAGQHEEQDMWDWSMEVVATLCRQFHSQAADLTLELNGERFVIPTTTAGLHRTFDRLAAFEPTDASLMPDSSCLPAAGPSDTMTIVVTSSRRWETLPIGIGSRRGYSALRTVVLDETQDDDLGANTLRVDAPSRLPKPWLHLESGGDRSRQLQQQWERQCHDDWAS